MLRNTVSLDITNLNKKVDFTTVSARILISTIRLFQITIFTTIQRIRKTSVKPPSEQNTGNVFQLK